MNNKTYIIRNVQNWVEGFVVALNICPFAKREVVKQRVRYCVSDATSRSALTNHLQAELKLMQADASIETSLLIHPNVLLDFYDYNDYLVTANRTLFQLELEGVFQIASFHPQYQFAGTDIDDAENYTNRAPYPILHILRENSLTEAIDNYPDVDDIPDNNIAFMNMIGTQELIKMLARCKE